MTKYSRLREIVSNIGDPDILASFDSTVEDAEIGRSAKESRSWVPLCKSYPNIKGVTCEEIDEFIEKSLPPFFYSQYYKDEVAEIKKEHKKLLYSQSIDDTEYDEINDELKERYHDLITDNVCPDELNEDQIYIVMTGLERSDNVIKYIDTIDHTNSQFVDDYLHHIKVYDRDEAYTAFKRIGDQIEADDPGILHDRSTIFVTTPRGGYEMLSTFAYANDIKDKGQIPSDIIWSHLECDGYDAVHEHEYRTNPHKTILDEDATYFTEIYGKDWMDHVSEPVENIFIVDDIIASGDQVHRTVKDLRRMFPDASINSVTLCKRDNTSPALPSEVNKYYTDTPTIGINEFTSLREEGEIDNEYITCLFSHAAPDGTSDKLMIKLMGNTRYPPERRISREDL